MKFNIIEKNLSEKKKKTFWICQRTRINKRKIIRVNINYESYIHLSRESIYVLKLHRLQIVIRNCSYFFISFLSIYLDDKYFSNKYLQTASHNYFREWKKNSQNTSKRFLKISLFNNCQENNLNRTFSPSLLPNLGCHLLSFLGISMHSLYLLFFAYSCIFPSFIFWKKFFRIKDFQWQESNSEIR